MKFDTVYFSVGPSDGISFPITNIVPTDKYILKSITGLGPPDINNFIASTSNDIGFYQGRSYLNKEIVALIRLNPDYSNNETVEMLRINLYKTISAVGSPNSIFLINHDSGEVIQAGINVWIKKFEINQFSKDPEVQITFDTDSPFLTAPEVEIDVFALDPDIPNVINSGELPVGFNMSITFTDNIPSGSYIQVASLVTEIITINYPFIPDDSLYINTIPGIREITLFRYPDTINLLPYLSDDSTWLKLYPGDNFFDISANPDFDWDFIAYTPQYWGV